MSTSAEYAAFVVEQLDGLHGLRSARLFGGVGLSVEGMPFGMIIRNVLYFAVDDATRPRYEAAGSTCFSYGTKLRQVDVRSYYEVPAEWIEDRERLRVLALEALDAAASRRRPRPAKAAGAAKPPAPAKLARTAKNSKPRSSRAPATSRARNPR